MNSSVLANCRFMYPSEDTRNPCKDLTRYLSTESPRDSILGESVEEDKAINIDYYLVLVSPLQLDHDGLSSESIEERLGVHRHRRHPRFSFSICNVNVMSGPRVSMLSVQYHRSLSVKMQQKCVPLEMIL